MFLARSVPYFGLDSLLMKFEAQLNKISSGDRADHENTGMNRMKKSGIIFVCIAALTLAGCEGAGEKEKLGTILGAAAGAIVGSQVGSGKGRTTAVAVGTLLGSLAGSSVGKSLDKLDLIELQKTQQGTLENNPSGKTSTWSNPDSGNSGTITPQPARQTAQGVYCREYQQTITVGGRTEEAYGEACRQPDGTWKIIK